MSVSLVPQDVHSEVESFDRMAYHLSLFNICIEVSNEVLINIEDSVMVNTE